MCPRREVESLSSLQTRYATLISASCLLETGMLTADWLCEGAFYHVFGACRAGCVS